MREFRTGRLDNNKKIEEIYYFGSQEEAEQNARTRSLATANVIFLVQERNTEDEPDPDDYETLGFYQDGEEMIGM